MSEWSLRLYDPLSSSRGQNVVLITFFLTLVSIETRCLSLSFPAAIHPPSANAFRCPSSTRAAFADSRHPPLPPFSQLTHGSVLCYPFSSPELGPRRLRTKVSGRPPPPLLLSSEAGEKRRKVKGQGST